MSNNIFIRFGLDVTCPGMDFNIPWDIISGPSVEKKSIKKFLTLKVQQADAVENIQKFYLECAHSA